MTNVNNSNHPVNSEEPSSSLYLIAEKLRQLNWFNFFGERKKLLTLLGQVEADVELYDSAIKGQRYKNFLNDLEATKRQHEMFMEQEYEKLRVAQQNQEDSLHESYDKAHASINAELAMKQQLLSQLNGQYQELILSEESLYDYYHPAADSVALQNELSNIRIQVKAMVQNKTAVSTVENFTFNNSVAQGTKFVKDFGALMLTAYNQEAENAIVKATGRTQNVEAALNRLERASQKITRLGSLINIQVNPQYHWFRRREIELAFMYKERLAQEKEEEQEHKEALREEARVIKEAQSRQEKLEKEERELQRQVQLRLDAINDARIAQLDKQSNHYKNVIQQLSESDPALKELQIKLAELEVAKERNQTTLANIKAGYVYAISNIGSFGEGVMKIGLTRREEPMNRVRELSGASVPFHFDVHALHFSDDAVGLETALHKYFAQRSVNKVNMRKEFFRVTPTEVRDAMSTLSNGTLLSFVVEADAPEYRQSLTR